MSNDKSVTDYLKALSFKDPFYMAGTAWGEVTPKRSITAGCMPQVQRFRSQTT